ncbi:MAG: hypothetical protein K9N23_08475 [Akkermansiaceae bacterium]|nr:hypothetical protein [Akkermansiaceae bacterium]MCF7731710.1 hypothetical protein [Akkermansiaceae bacterium]
MNPSLDWLQINDLLFGAAGVIGLALLALAAASMARGSQSWGARLLAGGAVLLLLTRVHVMASPHLLTPQVLANLGWRVTSILFTLPPLMLTVGLVAVVWGVWACGRELRRVS